MHTWPSSVMAVARAAAGVSPSSPKGNVGFLQIVRKFNCYSYTVNAVTNTLEHVVVQVYDDQSLELEVYDAFVRISKTSEGVHPPCGIHVVSSCYVNVSYKVKFK